MKINSEEILKCACFVILGYFVAMIFSRMCSCNSGFRVGGRDHPGRTANNTNPYKQHFTTHYDFRDTPYAAVAAAAAAAGH